MQVQSSLGMEVANRYASVPLARFEPDFWEPRTVWDRILGVATMAVTSAGGWAAIIAIIRYLGSSVLLVVVQ